MNRKIKFRAWNTKMNKMFSAEQMAEDQLTLLTTGKFINVSGSQTTESIIYPLKTMIPMQFTGLLDKNGKEIYEGDIVEFIVDSGEMKATQFGKSTISFWDFEWHVGTPEEEYGDSLNEFYGEDLEIIGNIYESPNLISNE